LSLSVIRAGEDDSDRSVFTVTDGGFAKRTRVSEYREQGRGGLGIKAMKLNEDRGSLVGGLVVTDNDEVIAIKASGQITRSAVSEVPVKGRDTMGVKFVGVADDDSVVVIALNPEAADDPEIDPETTENGTDPDQSAVAAVQDTSTDSAESDEGDPAPTSGADESDAGDGVEEDEQ
jgi:DNA gyrase subunit A